MGPTRSERIYDPDFEALVQHIGERPGMFGTPTLATVVAYLDGFDRGRSGAPLLGLREWLVVRNNRGDNLVWSGLVHAWVGDPHETLDAEQEQARIRKLCELLGEFLRHRYQVGLTKIFYDYGKWLRRQRWYEGPLREGKGG